MSKALISMESLSIASEFEFKDKRLAQATAKIAKLYSDTAKYVDAKNREFASILSTVKTDKSYEADGFKSVADYAAQVFGLSRSNAYALASAGDIYNDNSAPNEAKNLSPSKLAEIVNVPMQRLYEDIKSGVITPNTTQQELREYAKHVKETADDKPVVLSRFTARFISGAIPESLDKIIHTPRTMDEWHDILSQYIIESFSPRRTPEVVRLPKCASYSNPCGDKKTTTRYLYITESASMAFEFYTYREGKSSKPSKPKFTKEQLLAMLAEMDDEEEK